ncbi:type I-B CRISPR-associated protein Cas7/Csh2 [Thermus antranikianii]
MGNEMPSLERGEVANGEILFLYDAKDTNPNGDPDSENRPRMDHVAGRILVSDVRLKRYVREYLLARGEDIWVRLKEDGSRLDADGRRKELEALYKEETGKEAAKGKELTPEFLSWLLGRLRDIRLFGAVLPIKSGEDGGKGGTGQFVGPVQFHWGYSLHQVEVYGARISSVFAGRTEGGKGQHGTFGVDYRVRYALIGFWGRISRNRAKAVGLSEADLEVLERGLLEGLLEGATTRSKIGQTPRLYLRVDWKEGFKPLGDPRDGLQLHPKEGVSLEAIRQIADYHLDASGLQSALERYRGQIARIRYWKHEDLEVKGLDLSRLGVSVEPVAWI